MGSAKDFLHLSVCRTSVDTRDDGGVHRHMDTQGYSSVTNNYRIMTRVYIMWRSGFLSLQDYLYSPLSRLHLEKSSRGGGGGGGQKHIRRHFGRVHVQ